MTSETSAGTGDPVVQTDGRGMTGASGESLGGVVEEPRRDPVPARAPEVSTTPTEPRLRTATVSSPARIGFGVSVLALGVALGIADQRTDNTDMVLRVPALIAALIMVAQGIQLVLRGMPRETEVEVVEVIDDTDPRHEITAMRPRPTLATMMSMRATDPASLGLPTLIVILAIWLGLADLKVDPPDAFGGLAIVSAFVLFAIGWTRIPSRTE